MNTIDILGTKYTIEIKDYGDDESFKEMMAYVRPYSKQIRICNLSTHPSWKDCTDAGVKDAMGSSMRHEITHAFLHESGLGDNTCCDVPNGWANNEEMIDWFALQSPKIYAAFREAGCI